MWLLWCSKSFVVSYLGLKFRYACHATPTFQAHWNVPCPFENKPLAAWLPCRHKLSAGACNVQDALSPRTSVFLSDVETDIWAPDTVMQLAALSDRWLVTRGEFGAHQFTAGQGLSLVQPVKVDYTPAHLAAVSTQSRWIETCMAIASGPWVEVINLSLSRHFWDQRRFLPQAM